MSQTVKITEDGKITLPREVMGAVKTDVDYRVQVEGNTLRFVPAEEDTASKVERLQEQARKLRDASPEDRVKAFREWLEQPRPSAPVLPDEALHRESMYD